MKKIFYLTLLFSLCSNALLIAQETKNPKHEILVQSGFSLPLKAYRNGTLNDFNFKAYNGGSSTSLDYINHFSKYISGNISFGYIKHFSTNELESHLNEQNTNANISKVTHQHAEFGLLHLMPGIQFETPTRLKCIGFFNFGGLAFLQTQPSFISQYNNSETIQNAITLDINNGFTWAFKTGLRLQYPISTKMNVLLQSEYLQTKGQAIGRSETIINGNVLQDIEITSDFEMETWNISVGVSYWF